MKTQRRHELQTNVLADWLGHQIEQVRPYSKTIVGILVGALLLFLVAAFVINVQSAKNTAGWSDFYAASFEQSSDRLRSVAEQHAGTDAGLWALLGEADLEQSDGLRDLFKNRDSAQEHLDRAKQSYEQVEKAAANEPELLRAARFGLAQVYEALSDLDKAKEYFTQVAQDGETGMGREAQRRLDLLDDPEVKRFYNWFANQEPLPQPPAGLPSGLNFPDLGDLPERSDLTIPLGTTPAATDQQQPAEGSSQEKGESETEPAGAAEEVPPSEPTADPGPVLGPQPPGPSNSPPAASEPGDDGAKAEAPDPSPGGGARP